MEKIELLKQEISYALAEELKTLRTNILFSGGDKKVIMITSCLAGEGKSTVSLNIAKSFTEIGKKVLYIDADLRKSVFVKQVVKGKMKNGLSSYLSGQAKVQEVMYGTDISGLFVIHAGVIPPNPSELLSTPAFSKLIQASKELFDYIIIDCPPLGMVVDAAVIAPSCDGAVLLIESYNIKYSFAQEVKNKLISTKCPVLGVVLNKVDRKKENKYYGKYYQKRYESYYKVEETEKVES
ncbi:MAG: CpsD/CapB family tyrosine-protein kinase [Lachnospiraceae bacterium]